LAVIKPKQSRQSCSEVYIRYMLASGTSGIFTKISIPRVRKWPFPVATTITIRASSRKANKRSLYNRAILHSTSAWVEELTLRKNASSTQREIQYEDHLFEVTSSYSSAPMSIMSDYDSQIGFLYLVPWPRAIIWEKN